MHNLIYSKLQNTKNENPTFLFNKKLTHQVPHGHHNFFPIFFFFSTFWALKSNATFPLIDVIQFLQMIFITSIVTRRKGYQIELSSSDLNNKQFIWSN